MGFSEKQDRKRELEDAKEKILQENKEYVDAYKDVDDIYGQTADPGTGGKHPIVAALPEGCLKDNIIPPGATIPGKTATTAPSQKPEVKTTETKPAEKAPEPAKDPNEKPKGNFLAPINNFIPGQGIAGLKKMIPSNVKDTLKVFAPAKNNKETPSVQEPAASTSSPPAPPPIADIPKAAGNENDNSKLWTPPKPVVDPSEAPSEKPEEPKLTPLELLHKEAMDRAKKNGETVDIKDILSIKDNKLDPSVGKFTNSQLVRHLRYRVCTKKTLPV